MGGQSAEDDEAFAEMAHKFGISNKKSGKISRFISRDGKIFCTGSGKERNRDDLS